MKPSSRPSLPSHTSPEYSNKRIKHHEPEPEGRCTADIHHASGYEKPLRWSRKHELSRSSAPLTRSPASRKRAPATVPSFRVNDNASSQYNASGLAPQATPSSTAFFTDFQQVHKTTAIPTALEDIGLDSDVNVTPWVPNWLEADVLGPHADIMLVQPSTRSDILEGVHGLVHESGLIHCSPQSLHYGSGSNSQSRLKLDGCDACATSQAGDNLAMNKIPGCNQPHHDQASDSPALPAECASTRSASSLLHTFYRLSSPSRFPGYSDADFVCHYFKHVCRLYSCYDSKMNPFRRLVADRWSSSPTIYSAIQSMAIAHIANWYPYMVPLGLKKRGEAYHSLQQDLQLHRLGRLEETTLLLSLVLLGPSSAWHFSSNLGIQYLNIARSIVQCQLQRSSNRRDVDEREQHEFFESALIYWEMLASFIDPTPITPFPGHGLPTLRLPVIYGPIIPHSWTAIVPEIFFVVAEIGRLLRRCRSMEHSIELHSESPHSIDEADEAWAAALQKYLIAIEIPSREDQIADYQDRHTPKADLVRVAEAYRHVGLLELHQLVPALIRKLTDSDAGTLSAEVCRSIPRYPPHEQTGYACELDAHGTMSAMYILEALDKLAISSAACRLQPFVLLAAASQLRMPITDGEIAVEQHDRVIRVRYAAEERLLELSRKYPQKPLLRMFDIVKEVWSRLDSGSSKCHWMDVMNDKGWHTILG